MKKILLSLLSISAVAIVAVAATGAFFSDTETSVDNTFIAGELDLQIDYEGYYNKEVDGQPNAGSWTLKDLESEKFFDFDDVKPGDYGEGTISLHVYDNDAWGCVTITPTRNDDVTCTEPELVDDVTCTEPGSFEGELAQSMQFRIWADVCRRLGAVFPVVIPPALPGDNIYQESCDILLTEGPGFEDPVTWALADSQTPNVFTGSGPLVGSNDYYIGVSWSVPSGVGNEIQSDLYQADISFYTEQWRNNESFVCGSP